MPVFRFRQTWGNLEDLELQVERLLVGMKFPIPIMRWERQFPPLNLYDLEGEFLLIAEIPGGTPETIELTVTQGVLTIKSAAQPFPEGAPEQFRRQERFHGAWERSLNIPDRVQEEQVAAEFHDGLLRVHLPKIPTTRPRQIPVVSQPASPAASKVISIPPQSTGEVE